jgi:ABC-type transport system involved in multi-copper enzyme maturation permease subunit
MTATITPYRSGQQAGHDGFAQLLRAEWTKFRTMRGWIIVLLAAAVATGLAPVALASIANSNNPETCVHGICQVEASDVATGPDGQAVTDSFYFVHQPLAGNGSLTVAISSLRGTGPLPFAPVKVPKHHPALSPFPEPSRTQPWAKAGILIKAGTRPGSPYAAIMLTAGHGVRMQYDFTHDIAGPPAVASATSPRWLRLARSGATLTGYSSADGRHWATVATVHLPGLPATAQAGLFVASPDYLFETQSFGGGDQGVDNPTQATAVFGLLSKRGDWPAGTWTGGQAGFAERSPGKISRTCNGSPCGSLSRQPGQFRQSGGTFTVAGSGDIAPFVPVVDPLQVAFYGTLFGAIAVIALGAVFITGEYRRGMIRTTLAASPRRGRVLAAKALVIGPVTFAAGLAGAAVAFPVAVRKLHALSWKPPVWPVWSLTSQVGVRMVVGTAALLAVTALLALAAGTILRRSAGAITAVIGLVIVPLVLSVILPTAPADWLLRYTPAAAFGLQTSTLRYPQVTTGCVPYHGCYPLGPWTGFAVMCAWAALALAVAAVLLRRRDA